MKVEKNVIMENKIAIMSVIYQIKDFYAIPEFRNTKNYFRRNIRDLKKALSRSPLSRGWVTFLNLKTV